MADAHIPKILRDLAQVLKRNHFNVLATEDEVITIFNICEDKKESVLLLLKKVPDGYKRLKNQLKY